jgi:subtilisin family serine protease
MNQTTRIYGWIICLIAFLGIMSGSLLYASGTDPNLIGGPVAASMLRPHVSNEVMVVLKGGHSTISPTAINGRVIGRYNVGRKTVLRVKLPAGTSVEKVLAENWAAMDWRILRVEPNYQVYALGIPNDSYFNYLWGLYNTGQTGGTANCDIQAPDAWDVTTGSNNVVVAVIDSGINYSHPDLCNRIWNNPNEIKNNGIDDDGNGYVDDYRGWNFARDNNNPIDENGHGTHCAGTIAAEGNNGMGITGVAWNCRIMPCRFLNADGSGTVADAIEAINYAVANGADILNNSWGGGGYSEALKAAIENAHEHGVLFVAAAGNSARDNDIYGSYPANYTMANVISVAATNPADNLAPFSCYGKNSVHLAAPGVNVLSTVPEGYAWMSGTSCAAPYVSGAAALLLAANPQMNLAELKARLMWCGDAVASLENKTMTGRRLNVYAALTAQDGLSLQEPSEGTHWVTGFDYDIQWISIGGGPAVSIFLEKAGQVIYTIAENAENNGGFRWSIPVELENASDYSLLITDGSLENRSGLVTIDNVRTNYHTEWFYRRACDLSNKSIIFVPDETGDYQALTHSISVLPTSVSGSTLLSLKDDSARAISLVNPVYFYGTAYTKLYIGSNGYITFDIADTEYRSSPAYHFGRKRLSVFFQDLDPTLRGQVYWKEFSDRVAVSWLNIALYNSSTAASTFQAELYHDGKIRLSWLKVSSANPIVGFSQGGGIPVDYQNEDLSACATYEPLINSIAISSPRSLFENSSAALSCTSYHEYGIVRNVDNRNVQWSTSDPVASIDLDGLLTLGEVDFFKHINITAGFDGQEAGIGLCVKDGQTKNITLRNCSITKGTVSGYESIAVTGKISIDAGTVKSSDAIILKLWNKDNECVYIATFDNIQRYYINNVYSRTFKNGIQSQVFRLEPLRNSFSLGVINIELSGTAAPSYFTLECGSYQGLGIIN